MVTAQQQQIDEAKLMDFVGKAVGDLGAGFTPGLVVIGDRLGLFRAIANTDPCTPEQIAQKTGTTERYVREWANALTAAGYLTYAGDGRYTMTPEQTEALTNEGSPAF